MSYWDTAAGREALAARAMDRGPVYEAMRSDGASRSASEPPTNPWGPLPAVCCVWCQADLSVEPHAWWCRPEQYRITMPLPSEVRRDQGRTRRGGPTAKEAHIGNRFNLGGGRRG